MGIGQASQRKLRGLLSAIGERVGREINPHVMTPEAFVKRKAERGSGTTL